MSITSVGGHIQILIAFISIGASLCGRNHYNYDYHQHYPQPQYCGANEIPCASGGCINRLLACDGLYHCLDGSDETAVLCQRQDCPWYMFRCAYGACTKISSVCNGVYDCVDKSDESPYHACRLDNIPPIPTTSGRPSTTTTIKSTTKIYTPFPYPVTPTSPPKPPPTPVPTPPPTRHSTSHSVHTTPTVTTTSTSTTKHYTPFPYVPSSERPPTPQSTKVPTTSPTARYTTQSTTTDAQTSRKPPPTEKSSTSAPNIGSCTLPPRTSDRTYKIDGCKAGSSDAICRAGPGEPIDEGVALSFTCTSNTKSFTTYCVHGDWVPAVNSVSCEAASETSSDCGNLTANLRANTHIPWQVGIYDKSSDLFTCQGVIVSPYAIVSAAHCFFDTTTNLQRTHSEFYITVGKKSRHKNVARSQMHNITEIRVQPDGFQGSSANFMGDIVLLEVTPAILFSPEVGSCCLDSSADKYSNKEIAGIISAYNDNGGNGYTETERVTFTTREKCVEMVEEGSKSLVTSDKICLVGESIEQGNAGSGLYTSKGGTSQSSQYRLRAIFSTTFYDASGQVTTLTDVGQHLSWLPKAVNEIDQSHESETLIDIRGPFTL